MFQQAFVLANGIYFASEFTHFSTKFVHTGQPAFEAQTYQTICSSWLLVANGMPLFLHICV